MAESRRLMRDSSAMFPPRQSCISPSESRGRCSLMRRWRRPGETTRDRPEPSQRALQVAAENVNCGTDHPGFTQELPRESFSLPAVSCENEGSSSTPAKEAPVTGVAASRADDGGWHDMRFGLFGSASARRGGAEFDSSEGFRDFIDYNVEAEALGFHSTFVVEHHFTGYGQVSATLNLLTWLGARTTRLRLGTAVMVLPWHNPVLLAEQAATLDLLSGGRLDFGIGKGYRYNEFAGFRMSMEDADARFDECLEVLLKAWAADEPFSYRGKHWEFDNIVVEPPPAQKPHPKIWMGAGSES